MITHYRFSDFDDEATGSYRCSDPDHYDKGVLCDGEHGYNLQYNRLREVRSEQSEDKLESTVNGKPQSPSHVVIINDYEGDDNYGDTDLVELLSDSGDDDPKSDSVEGDPSSNSEDACGSFKSN
ncbi:uncharacterized protein LOC141682580 [Apium graveolens]|uniref:uncharacterized protein LOC141682580 n=1 Tax=Apium graveolens TaxID=4045 RepID=UPI003D79CC5A